MKKHKELVGSNLRNEKKTSTEEYYKMAFIYDNGYHY